MTDQTSEAPSIKIDITLPDGRTTHLITDHDQALLDSDKAAYCEHVAAMVSGLLHNLVDQTSWPIDGTPGVPAATQPVQQPNG